MAGTDTLQHYWTELERFLDKSENARDVVLSLLVALAVLLVRSAALRAVRRARFPSERIQLRWTVFIRQGAWLVVLVSLIIVWAGALKDLALSLAAIAVAVVVASKELLLCIMGAIVRASSGSYALGDRIEVSGVRGDVIDHGVLTTTLLEMGSGHQWTGRSITVPNSMLLGAPVINETFTEAYVRHLITVPLDGDDDWQAAEQCLLEAAREVSADVVEDARRYMSARAREHGFDAPSVEPRVRLQVPAGGKVTLLVRLPTLAHNKGETEQRVLRKYLEWRRRAGRAASADR